MTMLENPTMEASLYLRKMTLNNDLVSAIEKTLLSSSASYSYLEIIKKNFLAPTGFQKLETVRCI